MSEIKKIKLSEIDTFKDHPFHVNNDDTLKELVSKRK